MADQDHPDREWQDAIRLAVRDNKLAVRDNKNGLLAINVKTWEMLDLNALQ